MLDTSTVLSSARLTLRPWCGDDAPAALEIYGNPSVARWLSPVMNQVPDAAAMLLLLQQWMAEDARMPSPAGRWAIELTAERRVIGGALLLPLPPGNEDMEIGWHLRPDMWGNGYASEATFCLAEWALSRDIDEIFAVVRPGNTHVATSVRRNGMQWVGETDKYFGLVLQVFRRRLADLDRAAPEAEHPPFPQELDVNPQWEWRPLASLSVRRVPLRLTLKPSSSPTGEVDGGWWPRSMDPLAEFPAMIAGVTDRVGPVSRVAYNTETWGDAPRDMVIDGEMVRLEGIRALDPRTVFVSGRGWQRKTLLVVPPEASENTAQAALTSAASPGFRGGAEQILLAGSTDGSAPDGTVPVPRSKSSEAGR
ncbi:hypothetical protein ALI144C_30675 [Actinosynnema sp. ALI-1.44]|nr:hypothetical protein ALI144C_30675 [Actinosynnema sp. ALI-1.44]